MHFHAPWRSPTRTPVRGTSCVHAAAENARSARHAAADSRVATARQRMRDDYYASPAIVDQLARRLLARGEMP